MLEATLQEPFVLPELVNFRGLVSEPRLRSGHLQCVSGSFIPAGDTG